MGEELKQLIIIRTLLRSGSFEIKGEAVPAMASSMSWLDQKIAKLQSAEAIKNGEIREIEDGQ